MKRVATKKSFLYKVLLLILVILFFVMTNLGQVRAEQTREESETLPIVEDRILTPIFSSPPLERNLFSPPLINQDTSTPRETLKTPTPKQIKPPDNIRLAGIIGNKLGRLAIIEISGKSYLIQKGSFIRTTNQELKVIKITNKEIIIKKGNHFFSLGFLCQAK